MYRLNMHLFAAFFVAFSLLACHKRKDVERCPTGPGLAMTPMRATLPDKTLSLTFDDGPSFTTLGVARYLHAEGIRATFFVIGNLAQSQRELLSHLRDLGHLIGNHSYSHPDLTESSDPVGEIRRSDELISHAVSGRTFLFRAPYGKMNTDFVQRVNQSGLGKYIGSIDWEIGDELSEVAGADWACYQKGLTAEACAALYKKEIDAKGKGVVLFHDTLPFIEDLVKALVPTLKAEGYQFQRLDEAENIKQLAIERGGTPGINGGDTCYDY